MPRMSHGDMGRAHIIIKWFESFAREEEAVSLRQGNVKNRTMMALGERLQLLHVIDFLIGKLQLAPLELGIQPVVARKIL